MSCRSFALAALALMTAEAAAAATTAQTGTFVAQLSGAGEAAGDPDGSGRAQISVDTGRQRLCYALTATGIAPASAAGLHRGAPTGRPLVRMVPPKDGDSRACVELSAHDANDILRRPETYVVSVRNAEHPDGALRGQLTK